MLTKILVIEAQVQTRNQFVAALLRHDFKTIVADNGRLGIQLALQELPDVVISEIVLPEVDGFQVLSELRQTPATATIPFLFVTTQVCQSNLRKALQLGANDYLTKPFTEEELLHAIALQIDKQNILRPSYTPPQGEVVIGFSHSSQFPLATPESIFPAEHPLQSVFDYIEHNYHRPISLGDVAQAVGYSPAYLTSLMRRQTGQTVQRWIIKRRMAAARTLLLNTNDVMEEIAAQVGYLHTVHFFRQFRQLHGTTPHVWRSNNRPQTNNNIEKFVSHIKR